MTTTILHVTGMTCEHCARAVTDELTSLAGVTGVAVDLATGLVEVSTIGPLDRQAARTSVEEAGYELADSP